MNDNNFALKFNMFRINYEAGLSRERGEIWLTDPSATRFPFGK